MFEINTSLWVFLHRSNARIHVKYVCVHAYVGRQASLFTGVLPEVIVGMQST